MSNNINYYTKNMWITRQARKTYENIESLLKHVVGNSRALLTSFHKSIIFLKNMDINSVAILDKYYFSIILLSLWIFIYNISDLYHVLDCHNFFASKLCITMASLIRSFAISISLDKNKYVSTSFTLSGIGASSLAKIFFFTSANSAFSSRSSLPSHNSSSVALVASLFSSLIIQSS